MYIVYRVLSIYRVLPGFREFAFFEKSKRFFYIFFGWVLHRGGQGPGKGPNICMYIVYRVLSIYRVLPGFREFAFFEKSKRFFYIFFGWVLHRGGQGPGKGPNVCISSLTSQHVYIGAGTSHSSARSLNCDNFGQEQYFLMR